MQGRAALGVALAAVVAAPATAAGSTVSVQGGEMFQVVYAAAPGESNDLTVSSDGATVTLEDPGADISAGNDCMLVSSTHAECDLGGVATVDIALGGGADEARLEGAQVRAIMDGGGGADRLVGGPQFDAFDGGLGPDVIKGRGSVDFLRYLGRTDDLRVTLGDGRRNDGGPQDGNLRDRLRGLESVLGGSGDDRFVGTADDNTLNGQEGDDVLRGLRGGDDLLTGPGRDQGYGGPGPDLFPGDSGKDHAVGGRGKDHFQGGAPLNGPDHFGGGPGFDTMQYSFGPVRVKLDGRANDGACADPTCASSAEGDKVAGIEEVTSSPSADLLIGSKRDEEFRPSAGADEVRARGGDDTITLNVDGDIDIVDCGAGIDEILGTPDAFDQNENCE